MNLKEMREQMLGQIGRLKSEIHDNERVKDEAARQLEVAQTRLANALGALETLDMIDRQFVVSQKGAGQ